MSSILLLNQYFRPDMAATAQLLADLAEDLTAAGHRVSVLTGRGRYALDKSVPLPKQESWNGIEIRRVWSTDRGRRRFRHRIVDYLSFLTSAGLWIVLGRRHETVVCLSTPPLVAVLGLLAALRGSHFVYKVEDLYPDIAIEAGLLRPRGLPARFFAAVSRLLLRRADAVVALDGAMRTRLLERGARRVEVIPNWADGDAIAPDPDAGRSFRTAQGLDDRFLVLHSGNMGHTHRFDAVIGAARRLARRDSPVLFLFVGNGPRRVELEAAAEDLPSLELLPYQPRDTLRALFNAADLHLVTLQPKLAGLLMPSKYSAALAAGKPVLLVGGEGADFHEEITSEGVGWTCHHDPEAIADAVEEAARCAAGRAERARAARSLCERKYHRRLTSAQWLKLVESLQEAGHKVHAAP